MDKKFILATDFVAKEKNLNEPELANGIEAVESDFDNCLSIKTSLITEFVKQTWLLACIRTVRLMAKVKRFSTVFIKKRLNSRSNFRFQSCQTFTFNPPF